MVDNTGKNSYVKKQITNALLRLLKEKELRDISISEITATAQVSRISFYRNYEDKDSVIKEYMYLTLNEWNKNNPKSRQHTEEDILGDIFAYLTEYKDFYNKRLCFKWVLKMIQYKLIRNCYILRGKMFRN